MKYRTNQEESRERRGPGALWHAPTFFPDTGSRGIPLFLLPGLLLGIFAGAVVLTWLYEGARCSILLAALWHLSLNIGSATSAGEGAGSVVVTIVVIVWSIVVSRAWHRRDQVVHAATGGLERRRAHDAGPGSVMDDRAPGEAASGRCRRRGG